MFLNNSDSIVAKVLIISNLHFLSIGIVNILSLYVMNFLYSNIIIVNDKSSVIYFYYMCVNFFKKKKLK